VLDGGKKGKRRLGLGIGNDKMSKMMNSVRILKKKKIAYAPNLGPSRKDDEYCAARKCQFTKKKDSPRP